MLRSRAEERSNVDTNAEGEVIELQRNAAAVIGFQLDILDWLHFNTVIEPIVAGEAC